MTGSLKMVAYAVSTIDGLYIKECYISGDSCSLVLPNPLIYKINKIIIIGELKGTLHSVKIIASGLSYKR
ncbi:hypothetical protein KDD93_08520 [Campylobacter sp. faydin G-24]|uniref:Uncharacterized protein n=1 Tax=Campylobacter anatolicus TaxID=2829105 RepID=A0ABS5HKQ7_9BACT|nr:hypothetical protein [Campylobacter anatolicus]MBR8464600.1 hypothetical protein [Campylobacter anatolicus]